MSDGAHFTNACTQGVACASHNYSNPTMVHLPIEVVMDSGYCNRSKVRTLEEAERMAALLIDEEEQAKQKALHKVYILVIALLHVSFSNGLTLLLHYCRLVVSVPMELFA